MTLYKRLTLVMEGGRIVKAFSVFPPDRNAEQVLTWLAALDEHFLTH